MKLSVSLHSKRGEKLHLNGFKGQRTTVLEQEITLINSMISAGLEAIDVTFKENVRVSRSAICEL